MIEVGGAVRASDYALVLGSNRARARHLRLAATRIDEAFQVLACAPATRTRDASGMRYLNAAIRIRSGLSLQALLDALRAIEDETGRTRGGGEVTLDIDIVASRGSDGAWQVHKADDLRRGYVRALLQRIGVEPG